MEIQLIDLPQVCLEEIFKKLPFADISKLGATCKYFREIAKTIFRLYFRNLEVVIEAEMEKIETEANRPESITISGHLHLALLHSILKLEKFRSWVSLLPTGHLLKFQTHKSAKTPKTHQPFQVLRILLSEAKMLKAHCWRYIRKPSYDFCFPAGAILDEFERILRNIRNRTLKKDMEPEITTTLFHLGETFYDYFDFKIENYFHESSGIEVKITSETNRQTFLPNIYNFVSNLTRETLLGDAPRYPKKNEKQSMVFSQHIGCNKEMGDKENSDDDNGPDGYNEKTLFGVKVLDILNCCASSNFHTLLLHNYENDGFKLTTECELRDINVLEALPTIGISLANSEKQLNKICRYIRNNVRWTNLFHPLQDLWMLEDAIEINRDVDTASALLRQWKLQRASSRFTIGNVVNDVCQYDYRKIISRFKNRFGLLIMASLECPTINNVPLKVQSCLESKYLNIKKPLNFEDNLEIDTFPEASQNTPKTQQIEMETWNGNVSVYKFHLELKIQYPSFLSETVREAILKVDQIGEKTTVVTDGDDMRKCATCRAADDGYED